MNQGLKSLSIIFKCFQFNGSTSFPSQRGSQEQALLDGTWCPLKCVLLEIPLAGSVIFLYRPSSIFLWLSRPLHLFMQVHYLFTASGTHHDYSYIMCFEVCAASSSHRKRDLRSRRGLQQSQAGLCACPASPGRREDTVPAANQHSLFGYTTSLQLRKPPPQPPKAARKHSPRLLQLLNYMYKLNVRIMIHGAVFFLKLILSVTTARKRLHLNTKTVTKKSIRSSGIFK